MYKSLAIPSYAMPLGSLKKGRVTMGGGGGAVIGVVRPRITWLVGSESKTKPERFTATPAGSRMGTVLPTTGSVGFPNQTSERAEFKVLVLMVPLRWTSTRRLLP